MWEYLTTEAGIRPGCAIGIFLALAAWEILAPRRATHVGKPLRWGSNLGLVSLNSLLLRVIAPLGAVGIVGAVGIALFAEHRGWGLFQNIEVPLWLAVVVSVILLDCQDATGSVVRRDNENRSISTRAALPSRLPAC